MPYMTVLFPGFILKFEPSSILTLSVMGMDGEGEGVWMGKGKGYGSGRVPK